MKKSIIRNCISFILVMALVVILPSTVHAADPAKYEMKGWTAGVINDSAGITVGYIGSDDVPTVLVFPMPKSLFAGHENDPSWTQYNSAAPILAYIKQFGVDNNIKEMMDATTFDPTILKALDGQGVTLKQLGGPSNPQVGKANYNDNINKVLVGVGIPAPDLSPFLGSTPKQEPALEIKPPSEPVQQPENGPEPPPQTGTPKTPHETPITEEPKVGTELNPVPEATMEPSESQANPERLDPPNKALEDTRPAQIEVTPAEDAAEDVNPSALLIGGIVLGAIFLAILTVFLWKKNKNENSL